MKINIWFLGVLSLLLALGQLQRIQIGSTFALHIFDVVFVAWLVGMGIVSTQFRNETLLFLQTSLRKRSILFLVIWIGLGYIGALLSGASALTGLLYLLRILLYLSFGRVLLFALRQKWLEKHYVRLAVSFVFIALLYFGFLQFFLMPDTRWLFFLGWDDHYHRLLSTVLDPNFAGVLLVMGWCFLQMHTWRIGTARTVLSILFTIGILLTYSRASYLAFVFVLLASAFQQSIQTKKIVSVSLITCVLFLIAVPLLPRPGGEGVKLERTASITARAERIKNSSLQLTAKEWIFGKGLFVPVPKSSTEFHQPDHAAMQDNWLFALLSGVGVVGTIAGVYGIFQLLRWSWQKNPWLFYSVCAVLIHGMFNASLFYPLIVILLVEMSVLMMV